MGFATIALTISIALVYNLFIHYMTSLMFRDSAYQQKFSNTLTVLFVAGVAGVVLGKIMLPDNPRYSNIAVNNGFLYGGLLLIVTSLFVNWENMGEELRLMMMGAIFGVLIYFAYRYIDANDDDDDQEVADILANTE